MLANMKSFDISVLDTSAADWVTFTIHVRSGYLLQVAATAAAKQWRDGVFPVVGTITLTFTLSESGFSGNRDVWILNEHRVVAM
jgi:hypothetical protein